MKKRIHLQKWLTKSLLIRVYNEQEKVTHLWSPMLQPAERCSRTSRRTSLSPATETPAIWWTSSRETVKPGNEILEYKCVTTKISIEARQPWKQEKGSLALLTQKPQKKEAPRWRNLEWAPYWGVSCLFRGSAVAYLLLLLYGYRIPCQKAHSGEQVDKSNELHIQHGKFEPVVQSKTNSKILSIYIYKNIIPWDFTFIWPSNTSLM